MNLLSYLKRIKYSNAIQPSLSVLKKLHKQHLFHVPFENLDIHYGNIIVPEAEKFYTKIVENGRGGFCYELNGSFNELLKGIGFQTRIVQAMVYKKDGDYYHAPFGHLALIVTIDGNDYLTDVGFGDFITEPLAIILNKELIDLSGVYRFSSFDKDHLLISKKGPDGFIPNYAFSLKAQKLSDFREQCHYSQTSPESHFTQRKVCSRLTKNGRISLSNESLKITENGKVSIVPVVGELQFLNYLEQYFSIKKEQL